MTTPGDPVADPSAPPSRPPASAGGGIGGDWPAQAADSIVQVVGTVRDKTTGPALTVARGVVYGLLILVVAVIALVLFVIAAIRLLDLVLPIWGAYLLLGALFVVAGWMLYRLRAPRAAVGNTP